MVVSRSISVAANCVISFFFIVVLCCVCVYIFTMSSLFHCVCVCIYHIFFIHSFFNGNLGCFHIVAIVNSAVVKLGCMYLFELQFFPDTCPAVGLLDHMVTLLWERSGFKFSLGPSEFELLRAHCLGDASRHLDMWVPEEKTDSQTEGNIHHRKTRPVSW